MSRLEGSRFAAQGVELTFEMDGEPCTALAGESIAAALIAAGRLNFKRDRCGQPRGLSCGMGVCFECEVTVDEGAPTRACLTTVRAGMRVRSTDYRKRPPHTASAAATRPEAITCDVLVVGAGPAGISAALTLADAGLSVSLVDERPAPGGQFFKPLASSQRFVANRAADRQYRDGESLTQRLSDADVRVMSNATIWTAARAADGRFEAGLIHAGSRAVVAARQLVLAAGAFESIPAFSGWTLPGVMTTGAAQSLARSYRVAPGKRILIAGNGPLNLQLACELLDGGVDVQAVAESARSPLFRHLGDALGLGVSSPALAARGVTYLAKLKRHGVPMLYGQHVARACGTESVEQVTLARLQDSGYLDSGSEQHYAVDALCVGYGLQPSNELARILGCRHRAISPGLAIPVRNEQGETDIPGVFIVGDGGVLGGAQVAQAEGRVAARAIAVRLRRELSGYSRADRRQLRRHRRFQRHLWSFYRAAEYVPVDPDVMICRCESVPLATVTSLIADGVTDFGSIKRCSRVGMGSCQGRYCQRQLARVVTELTGAMPAADELFESRVPVKPVPIAVLAEEKPEWAGYRSIDGQFAPGSGLSAAAGPAREAEVLVIGAGVIGLCTALYLARSGVDVLVVDRGSAFGQASGTNAGSLHGQLLSSDFGDANAAASPAGHALALQRLGIAEWQALETSLGADFEMTLSGGLVLAGNADELDYLQRKVAFEQRCGLETRMLEQSALRELLPAVSAQMLGAAYCEGEGKINPLLAGPAILRGAQQAGVRVLGRCSVNTIARDKNAYVVDASAGRIRCGQVVNAAGGWAAGIAALLDTQLPVRTAPQQMIVTEPLEPMIPLLVAAAKRHLTLKQVANGNVIIGGGWPAGYDVKRARAVNLRESIEGNLWIAQHVIPSLGGARMLRSWATVGVMIDGAPILGECPGRPGFYNVVGANGYTMGPILGRITAGMILGDEPPLDPRPFLLERFEHNTHSS